jgi:hypothetical protein
MKNKEFVPPIIAIELKKLGFDEPCLAYYDAWNGKFHLVITDQSGSFISKLFRLFRKTEHTTYFQDYVEYYFTGICTAPTFSQAFRWFREKHKIISVIGFYCNGDDWEDVRYQVTISAFEDFATHDTFVKSDYISYEEAELNCLIKLIEIVKDKT